MNTWKMVGLGVVFLASYSGVTSAQEASPSSTPNEPAVEPQEGTETPETGDEDTEIKPSQFEPAPEASSSDAPAPPQENEPQPLNETETGKLEVTEDDLMGTDKSEDDRPISIGALIGYGFYLGSGDLNGFGFGLGLNGGYTLDFNLYLGGRFLVFLGESDEISSIEASTSYVIGAVDVGYDLKLDPLLIRPLLGLGFAIHSGSAVVYSQPMDSDDGFFYLSPGVSILFKPIPLLFVGGNLYFDFVLPDGSTGLSLMATLGVNL